MKKLLPVFAVLFFMALIACNNSEKKTAGDLTPQARADSLEKQVMDGHNIAMPKSMRIPDLRKEIVRVIDSIDKLPAKAREAAAPYAAKLDSVDKKLVDAYDQMETWMEKFGTGLEEINKESMKDSIEQRIKFFATQKMWIDEIKVAVLESVKKADALLKEKF